VKKADAADRGAGQDRGDAERGERPDVGAVVDQVRGDGVVDAVAGEEGDGAAAELSDGDEGGAVGRLDAPLLALLRVEQRVEAGAPDDGYACGRLSH
jgi:hypothetical protein